MNSFIQNYIHRIKKPIPQDIMLLIENQIEMFNKTIDENDDLSQWDTTSIKFFLKENLKVNKKISDIFLYSTIYLQAIIELYDSKKYRRVIEIIENIKNSVKIDLFDDSIMDRVQYYYCLTLARSISVEFDAQVEYFKGGNKYTQYNYLKGFFLRNKGEYENAEEYYKRVLEKNPKHKTAKRELVIVYNTLQDYETALLYAEDNYKNGKDNLYVIHAYFDCLLELKTMNERQKIDISDILTTVKTMHSTKPTHFYYQIMAKLEAYEYKNLERAIEYLDTGISSFPNDSMYLVRDKFDICCKCNDLKGMKESLCKLEEIVKELCNKRIYISRKATFDLRNGMSKKLVCINLQMAGLSEKTITNLLNKNSL